MIPSMSTKWGFGECSQCQTTYSMLWKPVNCQGCGFFLGGSYKPAIKKPKNCCRGAVVVTATEEMSIFSAKTITCDDRCFVMKEGDMFFCSHKDCISLRATFVSLGGKGKESDRTDASANTSANASVDTPPTRRPTHYRHVGRHTTDAFIEKLTFVNSYFVTSLSWKQEQRHKKGRKHES